MSSRQSTAGGGRRAPKGEYIETDTGNKISRRSKIEGSPNIMLGGRTVIMADVHLRGDLHRFHTVTTEPKDSKDSKDSTSAPASAPVPTPATTKTTAMTAISIGKCVVISTGCVIKPPARVSRGQLNYYPMKIGDNVFIGKGSTISAIAISSHVHIGEHSTLQPFSIIKENVKILPHSVVPANMVVAPNSIVGGRPARVIGELPEGWGAGTPVAGGAGDGEVWVEGGDLRELVRSVR